MNKTKKLSAAENETDIDISKFLDTDYKNYVFYILSNRCLPSLCDGLKVGARKILHAAFNGGLKDGGKKKLINLSGDTLNHSLFSHGDNSLNGTIVTLSQQFKFNLYPLYIDSQNGSLRSPKASASPRYLYVQLSKYADLWKEDYELLDFIFDEGQRLEPNYYWPIIPMVLVNSQEGIGVGYKFYNISYNPIDIIDIEMKILKKEDISGFHVKPYISGIKQSAWKRNKEGKWVNSGCLEIYKEKDTVEITELPYFQTFDNFEKLLNNLIDKEIIKDWKNFSEGNNIKYLVKFPKLKLTSEIRNGGKENVYNIFKLIKVLPDDLLWVLDENGKIRHFLNPEDLIIYFTKWRLSKYTLRKNKMVNVIKSEIDDNEKKILFIKYIVSGKLKIKKRNSKEILKDMKLYKFPETFIKISIENLSEDGIKKLEDKNAEIKSKLEYINKTTTVDMFLDDLKKLKKRIGPDFK